MKELLESIDKRRIELRQQLILLKNAQDYENDLYQKIHDNRRNVAKMQEQTFVIQTVIVNLIDEFKRQMEDIKTI
jgi:hypothetical protein